MDQTQPLSEERGYATTADVARRAVELKKPRTPAGIRAAAVRGDLPVAIVVGKGQRLFRWGDVERWLNSLQPSHQGPRA